MERWKIFEIYGFTFWVSDQGNVMNWATGKYMYLRPNAEGYLTVRRQKDHSSRSIRVHRMVADCFVENPDNKPHVNHKDGVKYNNHYTNLEWVTHKENIQHAHDIGLVCRQGVNNSRATLTEDQVHEVCEWFQDNPSKSAKDASEIFQIKVQILAKIRCGFNWSHIRCLYKIPPLTSRAKFID